MAKSRFTVSDELWEQFRVCIPPHVNTHRFGGGRPRADDRACLDGIFFVLRTGCQWNALFATDICPSSTANDRFRQWVRNGTFQRFFHAGVQRYDELVGIDGSFLAMDGAMTKAPLGGKSTGPNPTDRAKSGTKRSLLVDARGVPLPVVTAGANEHDMTLFGPTLDAMEELPVKRPKPTARKPQGLCLDKGYDYSIIRVLCLLFLLTPHIRSRGEEAGDLRRQPGHKARRWVVERTHSWMNRFRRLLIRWEKDDEYYLGMNHPACGIIACQRAGLFG